MNTKEKYWSETECPIHGAKNKDAFGRYRCFQIVEIVKNKDGKLLVNHDGEMVVKEYCYNRVEKAIDSSLALSELKQGVSLAQSDISQSPRTEDTGHGSVRLEK